MQEELAGCALIHLLEDIRYVLKLEIVFLVNERLDWDPILYIIREWVYEVVDDDYVLLLPVFERGEVFDQLSYSKLDFLEFLGLVKNEVNEGLWSCLDRFNEAGFGSFTVDFGAVAAVESVWDQIFWVEFIDYWVAVGLGRGREYSYFKDLAHLFDEFLAVWTHIHSKSLKKSIWGFWAN